MLAYALVSIALFAITIKVLYTAFKPGLSDIPGPFLAKFTDAWRTYHAWKGDLHIVLQEWKAKHGNIIRIGPNCVLIAEQGEFQKLWGFKEDFTKSDQMIPWKQVANGKVIEGIASTQNKAVHAKLKRPIAGVYSNTNTVSFQPRVEETIKYFLKRLDEEFIQGVNAGRACDIDNWVQYFAFDIVGQFTISRRLGFLQQGHDIDQMLADLNDEFEYRGIVQNMPWVDRWIRKNPLYLALRTPTSKFGIRARSLITERLTDEKHSGHDMMTGFLEARKKHPEVVTTQVLAGYVSNNLLAGSDTTAVTMRSILYYVLRTPGVLQKLRKELDEKVTSYPPKYKEASDLSYLDACIREALRMHPIGAIVFERVVPESGYQMPNGRKFPAGTLIASTPWTLNFDEEIWGPKTREFRPERWLRQEGESVEAAEHRIGNMKHNDFSFSYGPRACLGKHIAWMEIIEVMPALFGLLDIEFVSEKPWKIQAGFFTRQTEMDVRMKWRQGVDKTKYID